MHAALRSMHTHFFLANLWPAFGSVIGLGLPIFWTFAVIVLFCAVAYGEDTNASWLSKARSAFFFSRFTCFPPCTFACIPPFTLSPDASPPPPRCRSFACGKQRYFVACEAPAADISCCILSLLVERAGLRNSSSSASASPSFSKAATWRRARATACRATLCCSMTRSLASTTFCWERFSPRDRSACGSTPTLWLALQRRSDTS